MIHNIFVIWSIVKITNFKLYYYFKIILFYDFFLVHMSVRISITWKVIEILCVKIYYFGVKYVNVKYA